PPRSRPTFVAPIFPLPRCRTSTPRANPTINPNGTDPIRYAAGIKPSRIFWEADMQRGLYPTAHRSAIMFAMPGKTAMAQDLATIVRAASIRPDVRSALESLYASVQIEIDTRRPRCDISGRCCRFESFGHRLYVT